MSYSIKSNPANTRTHVAFSSPFPPNRPPPRGTPKRPTPWLAVGFADVGETKENPSRRALKIRILSRVKRWNICETIGTDQQQVCLIVSAWSFFFHVEIFVFRGQQERGSLPTVLRSFRSDNTYVRQKLRFICMTERANQNSPTNMFEPSKNEDHFSIIVLSKEEWSQDRPGS